MLLAFLTLSCEFSVSRKSRLYRYIIKVDDRLRVMIEYMDELRSLDRNVQCDMIGSSPNWISRMGYMSGLICCSFSDF